MRYLRIFHIHNDIDHCGGWKRGQAQGKLTIIPRLRQTSVFDIKLLTYPRTAVLEYRHRGGNQVSKACKRLQGNWFYFINLGELKKSDNIDNNCHSGTLWCMWNI